MPQALSQLEVQVYAVLVLQESIVRRARLEVQYVPLVLTHYQVLVVVYLVQVVAIAQTEIKCLVLLEHIKLLWVKALVFNVLPDHHVLKDK